MEAAYLTVLRAAVLIVASALLLWAAGWAILSLTRVVRSPSSVVEAPSQVTSAELLEPEKQRSSANAAVPANDAGQRAFYDGFAKRYHAIYQKLFEGSLRADDKRLDRGEFDDLTIATAERLAAIRRGDLDFATDKADLEAFLPVITQAAGAENTKQRLARYRTAQKRQVVERV